MKQTCDEVLNALGCADDPLFGIAMRLGRSRWKTLFRLQEALSQRRFLLRYYSSRHRHTDFHVYSNFAMSRTIGWFSHWNEMMGGDYKMAVRVSFTGYTKRDYPKVM